MKSIVLLGVVVCFTAILQKSEAPPPPEKSCKAIAAEFAKRQIGGITKCTKSMKFKNGKDKAKKMNCILRCIMVQEKLLDVNGQATLDVYNDFMMNEFPPSQLPHFNGTFWNCMTNAFKTNFKPLDEDEFCTGYESFIKCLMGTIPGLCNWS